MLRYLVFLFIISGICVAKDNLSDQNSTSTTNFKNSTIAKNDTKNHIRPDAVPENRDRTHESREGAVSTNKTNNTSKSIKMAKPVNATNANIMDKKNATIKYDVVIAEKNDGTQVVGRKGVSYNKTIDAAKPLPKKPLFTEAEDNEPVNDSSLNSIPEMPDSQYVMDGKTPTSNFVVPIVAVILSVPLVAILISVFFRRSSEWWHHRHYRRMDFLIEGMYNN